MKKSKKIDLYETARGMPNDPGFANPYLEAMGPSANTHVSSILSADSHLNRLLEPVGYKKFLSKYWGKNYCLIKATDRGRFEDIYSIESLNRTIASGQVSPADLRLYDRAGQPVDQDQYSYDHNLGGTRLDVQSVLKHIFKDRGSLILQRPEIYDRPLMKLIEDIYDWTKLTTSVSTTMTLKGEKTLRWHWDANDLLVFQIEGRKKWDIYEQVAKFPVVFPRNPYFEQPGEKKVKKIETVILEQGDILYLPGGYAHNVSALKEDDSLHVTVAFDSLSWLGLVESIQKSVLHECISDVRFRAPPWGLLSGKPSQKDRAYFKKLIKTVTDKMMAASLQDSFEQFVGPKDKMTSAQNRSAWRLLMAQRKLSQDTQFKRTRVKMVIEKFPDFVRLQVSKKVLIFDSSAFSALNFVNKSKIFKLKELPKLSGPNRQELIETLVLNGVVEAFSN